MLVIFYLSHYFRDLCEATLVMLKQKQYFLGWGSAAMGATCGIEVVHKWDRFNNL